MRLESWATFIGFLAGRQVTIHAQVKDWALDAWTDRYQLATGRQMPAVGAGYQVVTPDVNKWACSASIAFAATLGELMAARGFSALPLDVEVKQHGGQLFIYSEAVMWDLFHWGFMLGARQPAYLIREHVPARLLADFDAGLQLGAGGS